jgi:hypothetical protein
VGIGGLIGGPATLENAIAASPVDLSTIENRMELGCKIETDRWLVSGENAMRTVSRCFAVILVVGAFVGLKTSSATAQFVGGGTPLGGYGATTGVADSGIGGGPMVIPYGGMTEGFMPGRMGGGSSLSFRARPASTMSVSRASSIFSSFPGGMSSVASGMGRGTGSRSSMSNSWNSRGIGLGGTPFRVRSGGGGMGVMPPSFGNPFRQPPSLPSRPSGASGMSM